MIVEIDREELLNRLSSKIDELNGAPWLSPGVYNEGDYFKVSISGVTTYFRARLTFKLKEAGNGEFNVHSSEDRSFSCNGLKDYIDVLVFLYSADYINDLDISSKLGSSRPSILKELEDRLAEKEDKEDKEELEETDRIDEQRTIDLSMIGEGKYIRERLFKDNFLTIGELKYFVKDTFSISSYMDPNGETKYSVVYNYEDDIPRSNMIYRTLKDTIKALLHIDYIVEIPKGDKDTVLHFHYDRQYKTGDQFDLSSSDYKKTNSIRFVVNIPFRFTVKDDNSGFYIWYSDESKQITEKFLKTIVSNYDELIQFLKSNNIIVRK